MKFWNDVTKTVKDTANLTVKKANELSDTAKLKYKLHNAEEKLSCTYEGIGRLYYEAVMEGAETVEAISDLIADVEELKAEVRECREALAAAKNKKLCPNCEEEINEDSFYCSHCGKKLEG